MKYSKGFTLIELMVTLAVAGTLAMLAIPASDMIRKNRNLTLVQEFATSLNLARSEAIKRSGTVTVCKRTEPPPSATEEECDNAATWASGWLVFVDTNGDGTIGNGTTIAVDGAGSEGDDDPVIRAHQAISEGYTFGAPRNTIGFKSSGLAINGAATWTLCDSSGQQKYAHGVVVSINGRVRLSEDSNDDGIREGKDGVNLACP